MNARTIVPVGLMVMLAIYGLFEGRGAVHPRLRRHLRRQRPYLRNLRRHQDSKQPARTADAAARPEGDGRRGAGATPPHSRTVSAQTKPTESLFRAWANGINGSCFSLTG